VDNTDYFKFERFKKHWWSEKSMSTKILNKKQIKSVVKSLKNQYALTDLGLDYVFVSGSDDKIYVVDKKFAELDVGNLRINSVGLYFCTLQEGKVRLSIEGSQIIGPSAKRNVLIISKRDVDGWVAGNDLVKEYNLDGFVLIKYGDDFYGSGKCKSSKVLNYIPKSRRIRNSNKDLEFEDLVKQSGGND